jgi:hypothetical protein
MYICEAKGDRCGGGLEYLHSSPASRKRRQKGNPVPGVYLGHPVPRGCKYGDLALQVGGVSNETVKYGLSSAGLRPKSDCSGKAHQSSRQRGRYKITNPQPPTENFKEKEKLVAGLRWVPDTKTDWPTDCRS